MGWLEEVKAARSEGSLEKSLGLLNAELAKRPNDGTIYYQIAWTHDALGRETDAAPNYERAIALGLPEEDLRGAYLGLGSTYRCLGQYEKSREVLEKAIALFPEERAYSVFLALTQYNLKEPEKTIETLLQQLVATTKDASIAKYGKALLFYSNKLNETFD